MKESVRTGTSTDSSWIWGCFTLCDHHLSTSGKLPIFCCHYSGRLTLNNEITALVGRSRGMNWLPYEFFVQIFSTLGWKWRVELKLKVRFFGNIWKDKNRNNYSLKQNISICGKQLLAVNKKTENCKWLRAITKILFKARSS